MPASPKPSRGTHARAKARAKREQAKADRRVYAAVDARDGMCCRVCGIYCGKSIERHHILYRSLGGKTTLENIVSLCQKHHRAVHAKLIQVAA